MSAGDSLRFRSDLERLQKVKKQWLYFDDVPLWLFVLRSLSYISFDQKIIVANEAEIELMRGFVTEDIIFVKGGNTRAQSVSNSLQKVTSEYAFITDVARVFQNRDVCLNLLKNYEDFTCSVPYLNPKDAMLYVTNQNIEAINREGIFSIQTPQISKVAELKKALSAENGSKKFVDESAAILYLMRQNGEISQLSEGPTKIFKSKDLSLRLIKGDRNMHKLTDAQDLFMLEHMKAPSSRQFIGSGFDVHEFERKSAEETGKKMLLGGVHIPGELGFKAHSDGDVLLHSICDAILGAIGSGDIGQWFPDTDSANKNIDSKFMLDRIYDFAISVGFEIINIDCTIIAEVPKINPYRNEIRQSVAKLLGLAPSRVNIKATTTEKLGFIGRKEGVATQVAVTLGLINWKTKTKKDNESSNN